MDRSFWVALVSFILLTAIALGLFVVGAANALAHGGHVYCGTGTHKPNWYTTDKYFGTEGVYKDYERFRFGIYTGMVGRYCP